MERRNVGDGQCNTLADIGPEEIGVRICLTCNTVEDFERLSEYDTIKSANMCHGLGKLL